MNVEKLRTVSTALLIDVLENSIKNNDQEIVNAIAYELAYRIYVPNHTESFEDLLLKLGYKEIEQKTKKLRPSSNG